MRLAVFTNQFPGPVSTFFARDMRGLIDAGIEIDIFPIYPYDASLWRYVPKLLSEKVLPRNKVHHLTFRECLGSATLRMPKKLGRFFRDTLSISLSAIRYGAEPFVKSSYVFPKARAWAHQHGDAYDHVLAYWGNYSATAAYVFHRLATPSSPFSLFLHAGIDLYRTPVFMREKLLYADNVITCSDFNDRFIRKHYPDIADHLTKKIFVHRHGLDLEEFSFQDKGRLPGKVIAVGRLEKAKGFEFLLQAAEKLTRRGVAIEIEIVGDGPEKDNLNALSGELGIGDHVTFCGWVTPDEVRTIIQQASVLVHPSVYLGDGVPNVIKEAMALGTPVVSTAVAGIPEILDNGNNGIIVAPQDSDTLASAIKTLLSDNSLARRLAQVARRYTEQNFDMRANGQSLANRLFLSKTPPGFRMPLRSPAKIVNSL